MNYKDKYLKYKNKYLSLKQQIAGMEKSHSHLERFLSKDREMNNAYAEIERGCLKTSHWIWYVFPTPPYFRNGIEAGSPTNKEYALRSSVQVQDYINNEFLRNNYLSMLDLILHCFGQDKILRDIFSNDYIKVINSIKMFELESRNIDMELNEKCNMILTIINQETVDSIRYN